MDRRYLLPVSDTAFGAELRRIIKAERIDLVIPTGDADVLRLASIRNKLGCRVYLPKKATIDRCNDKYSVTQLLRGRRIPVPLTFPIESLDKVDAVFQRFAPRTKLWCRVRGGAGSYAAIPVRSPEQVRGWIEYWEQMRAVPPGSFTLSEYLPGRDFCVQCLWDNGTLVLAKMAERITYFDTGSPSGVSSMPTIAKTFFDRRVLQNCRRAIRAVDPGATGVFFVDIKENDMGEPCITEINAGRFATMTNLHDLTGKHNMAVLAVRIALGERIRIRGASDFAEGNYVVRSVDTEPFIIGKGGLFEGMSTARRLARGKL
ncbi:MAG: ATP-grasp domain-containing protein [Burkholderiales bacterium]|nr:ATP-grasp domain-containing protein [Burkholderiales bacterium]